jgi:ATP/maltotriose-dependent transcriptional regulator MalT
VLVLALAPVVDAGPCAQRIVLGPRTDRRSPLRCPRNRWQALRNRLNHASYADWPLVLARHSRQMPGTRLTEREREVLALMAEGRSNSAIA